MISDTVFRKLPIDFLLYIVQTVVIVVVLFVGLDLTPSNLQVPLVFSGDALHHLTITKAIIESGWWWRIENLSAPFGLQMVSFPVGGTLDYLLIKLLAFFSNDPGVVLNSFWITSVVLAGISATWSFLRLGLSRPISFVIGSLYAFIPHAFARNISHLMLVFYLVPLISAMAILILRGMFFDQNKKDKAIFYTACVAVGLNYIYTAFFSCFVLLVSAALCLWRREYKRHVFVAISAMLIIAATTFLNLLPTLVSWKDDPGAQQNIARKSIAEAEIYGLKLRHLITPIQDHPFPPLRELEKKTRAANFPLDNENAVERLGTIGSFGFLVLLGVSMLGRSRALAAGPTWESLHPVASVNLAVFLLATIGGFGAVFNGLVSPEVRAYNRIAVFTALFSFYAVGVVLASFQSRYVIGSLKKIVFLLGLILIAGIGLIDQANFNALRITHLQARAMYDSVQSIVSELEASLPKGSMIYQLPYVTYPHTPPMFQMESHQHLVPFVLSKNLRWSWPSLSSQAVKLNERLSREPIPELTRDLAILGYAGIWVDRHGYEDQGQDIVRALTREGGGRVMTSRDGRFVFIGLERKIERLKGELGQAEIEKRRMWLLNPPSPTVQTSSLSRSAYRVTITVMSPLSPFRVDEVRKVNVRLKNNGTAVLSSMGEPAGKYAVLLAYRWLNKDGQVKIDFGPRTALSDDLPPGGETLAEVWIKAPDAPGEYVLEFDMVQELVAWFGEMGSERARTRVIVRP